MPTYIPVSRTPIQYNKGDGLLANDYWLKFYDVGFSVPSSIYTDSTGSTALAKCKLGEDGFPLANPAANDSFFIPHLPNSLTRYGVVIYKSAADADANNLGNAFFQCDGIQQPFDETTLPTSYVRLVSTFAALSTTTAEIGQQVSTVGHTIPGYGGGIYNVVSSAGLVANSGTIAINGAIAFVKTADNYTAEDFGAYPGNPNCSPAFQAAINAIPSGKTGIVKLVSKGDVYNVSDKITVGSRNVDLDLCGATLYLNNNVDYLFSITGENTKVQNATINRDVTKSVISCFEMGGIQHRLENITSRDQKWPIFVYGVDLKESHFTQLRVDLDVSGRTGNIFELNYCVNNTMHDCFFGFCNSLIYGTSATKPVSGYANEGMSLTNIICVYARKTVTYDRVTSLSIGTGCVFDFCEDWGVFCTNGNNLTITPGVWIASNLTNGFIGVGTGGTFSDAHVDGMKCVRGASPITGTAGVSLPGPNGKVTGCSFTSGMNGGVVTMAGAVYGNSVEPPGTQINAISAVTDVIGALKLNGSDVWVPSAVSGSATAGTNGAPPAQVSGYATVLIGGVARKVAYYNV